MEKNIFKSIVAVDRYGVKYVKNFTIFAECGIGLTRWDSINTHAKHVGLTKYDKRLKEN